MVDLYSEIISLEMNVVFSIHSSAQFPYVCAKCFPHTVQSPCQSQPENRQKTVTFRSQKRKTGIQEDL